MDSSLYLWLNLLTLAGPLARSFEPRVRFHTRWFALLPSILITGVLFVAWDVAFTSLGVWGFNPTYLLGVTALGLPVEEWLFFLTVPYACVFMYDCLNYFWAPSRAAGWARWLTAAFGLVALTLAVSYRNQLYTVVTCGLSATCMAWAWYKNPPFLAGFWRAYGVALIPFFLVNGVLTGGITQSPVVWYNNQENMGLRLGTIPLEDAFYLLPLLWLVISQYEYRLVKR
jgi:lycopene cyclase domain-containing protein